VSFAHAVPPLVRLLRDEAELVPDLLRARPWLAPGDAEAVLNAVLDSEWTGFVARLGRVGRGCMRRAWRTCRASPITDCP